MTSLSQSLDLPCGATIPNRLAKAAMEESLAGADQLPDDQLVSLYRRWADGGAGLIITGHVMVDARAVAQPSDVVLEAETDLEAFTAWAAAAKSGGGQVWMQINHPGRVIPNDHGGPTWSPSDVSIAIGKFSTMYDRPQAMTAEHIVEVIERFAETARQAERSGFDGVEIHAAHGYLISQFLSPLTNRRNDEWGGSIDNRARLLRDVVLAVRAAVSPQFAVGVKLNSADFQRGGFDVDDARRVMKIVSAAGVDLIELSGGSIESLATSGSTSDGSTLAREAYFLEFAEALLGEADVPVMVTGGIRRRAVAEQVLASGVSMVGVATAIAMSPSLPRAWLADGDDATHGPCARIRNKTLAAASVQAATTRQLRRLANGHTRPPRMPAEVALLVERRRRSAALRRYLAWRPAG